VSSVGIRLSAARRARQWSADVTSLTLTDTDAALVAATVNFL